MKKQLLIASTSLFALAATPASAQLVDYGALESLFGEPVTTSATGSPQRATEVPADMEIITQDDIRRSGAQTIPDLLQFVPGVSVRREGINDTEVNVRGYLQATTPRLLVMVNGRQVYLDDYGYVAWALLPVQLTEIRQIEIVRGPASALFGFNAVSGVINIITYDPLYDDVSTVQVRGGTQGLAQGSAVATAHVGDDFGLRMSTGGYSESEFKSSTHNVRPYSRSFNVDTRYQLTPKVELFGEATNVGSNNSEELPPGIFGTSGYKSWSVKGGFAADTPIGIVNALVYNNHMDNTVFINGVHGPYITNNVTVAQASDLFKLNADNAIRAQLEYRQNDNSALNVSGAEISSTVYAASLMWDWKIRPGLSLTNSGRVDHLGLGWSGPFPATAASTKDQYDNYNLTAYSYNSGLVYQPTEVDTFRLLAGRGVQTPSLLNLSNTGSVGSGPGAGPSALGLTPSTLSQYEVSYDRKIAALNSSVKLALFQIETHDLMSFAVFSDGGSEETGVEIGLKGKSDNGLRWNGSYSYSKVTDHLSTQALASGSNIVNFQGGTPTSAINVGAGYSFGKFETDLQAHWQSHYVDEISSFTTATVTPVMVDNYVTLSARVGYDLTERVNIAVSGSQLGQARIVESGGPAVERRVYCTVTYKF